MTGLWLPAMKPKPWVGWRLMVTCRTEAGLMISLSIPSWLSSNIAELRNKTETQTHVQHTHPQTAAMLVQENSSRSRLLVPFTCVRLSILDLGHPLRGGSSMGQSCTTKALLWSAIIHLQEHMKRIAHLVNLKSSVEQSYTKHNNKETWGFFCWTMSGLFWTK